LDCVENFPRLEKAPGGRIGTHPEAPFRAIDLSEIIETVCLPTDAFHDDDGVVLCPDVAPTAVLRFPQGPVGSMACPFPEGA
jgi:hypothetical protein